MTIMLEIWFTQDQLGPEHRVLLESRPLADGERLPVTYALSWDPA